MGDTRKNFGELAGKEFKSLEVTKKFANGKPSYVPILMEFHMPQSDSDAGRKTNPPLPGPIGLGNPIRMGNAARNIFFSLGNFNRDGCTD